MSRIIKGFYELETELRDRLQNRSESMYLIAEKTGISKSRISDFKNGKFDFRLPKLNKLANYFGVKYRIENWEE